MKFEKIYVVLLVVVICFLCETRGDLQLTGSKCGDIYCQLKDYCSSFDQRCHPCSEICNKNIHNYDEILCVRNCQDYLHDIRYVRQEGASGNEDLQAVVQRLQTMVTITLTLTCFVLLALIIIVSVQVYKWKTNNDVTISNLCSKLRSKKSNANNNKSSGNGVTVTAQVSGKPDLRLDMPTTGTQSEHSPATLTTTISRRPAEDSALDYAYDNHAMSSSPSPNSKPHESNF